MRHMKKLGTDEAVARCSEIGGTIVNNEQNGNCCNESFDCSILCHLYFFIHFFIDLLLKPDNNGRVCNTARKEKSRELWSVSLQRHLHLMFLLCSCRMQSVKKAFICQENVRNWGRF